MTSLPPSMSGQCGKAASSKQEAKTAPCFSTAVPATPMAVRLGMQSLRDVMADWGAASELAARVELVAAEICNNIAEHGFKGRSAGEVHLHLKQVSPGMHLEITDNGSPPPASLLEGATLPSIDVASLDLPEGGFGWFLIHSETDALHYDQVDGKNRLTLRFAPR